MRSPLAAFPCLPAVVPGALALALFLPACSSSDSGSGTTDAATTTDTGGTGGTTSDAATGGGQTGGTTPDAAAIPADGTVGDAGMPDAQLADAAAPDAALPQVCPQTPPTCVDQMILDLSLHGDKVSTGDVTTVQDGDDFVTTIDATAGGFGNSDQNPWVYVHFGLDGATKVAIDDETALESSDWDMSLRRFIVRLNGGDSGPSCVGAVSFLEGDYATLNTVPDGLDYLVDDYYTDDCTIVNDSSGLPGSPQVVLAPWWSYAGCVSTTSVPHLIRLADGHVIKLVVEQYYEDAAAQTQCNNSGSAPAGAVSAVFTLRWRPMP